MPPLREEDFRAHLDAHGLLRDGAPLPAPLRDDAFTIFAQRTDARLEASTWAQKASQFFATNLGLTVDKTYDADFPRIDAARVVIAPRGSGEAGGTRLCYARPRTDDDLRAAREAEGRVGFAGLADLAGRCAYVWLVEAEEADDRVALRIAAIVASVVLGPILTPRGESLLGVKSARLRLESRRAP
jgi:hypothetical protein